MTTKQELQQKIAELKMEYINLQGDIEKLENTGHVEMITKAEERLSNMEKQLSDLNKQLAALS